MNTYMILFNYTEQGIRTVREAGPRLDGLKRTLEELGGKVQAFYLTMGPYDTVAIVTLPDDATMAKLALSLGAVGNVRTLTMRAFPEPEYRAILASAWDTRGRTVCYTAFLNHSYRSARNSRFGRRVALACRGSRRERVSLYFTVSLY